MLRECKEFYSLHSGSIILAKKYRVSSKAIRDIWNGRSWLEATFDLWDAQERPARKQLGRPKGRKDSKPRQTKVLTAHKVLEPLLPNGESFESVHKSNLFSVYKDYEKVDSCLTSACSPRDASNEMAQFFPTTTFNPSFFKQATILPPIHIALQSDQTPADSQTMAFKTHSWPPGPARMTPCALQVALAPTTPFAAGLARALLLGRLSQLFPAPAMGMAGPTPRFSPAWPPC